MVIKASAAAEVSTLVGALASVDEVQRESAIARLAVIGARAIDKLQRAYAATSDRGTRIAILRTLEAIPDPRNLQLASAALAGGGDAAVAAIGVLRSLLGLDRESANAALDALVTAAVETTHDRRLRVAALDALADVPGDVRERVAAALGADPVDARRVASADSADARQDAAAWQDALEGRLPDEPRGLREAVGTQAASAPLNSLRKLIDAVRSREGEVGDGEREAWRALRGSLHQALGLRNSRVALYDLRDAVGVNGEPLPPSFLAALHAIGDESCLEPLAAAWHAAGDERWRHQLAAAFHAIVKRERVSRRKAIAKRITARFPAAAALWT